MKRRAGSKPTAYDALQFKTLYLDLVGGGEATAPIVVTPATPTELDATTVSSASIYLEWSSIGENTTNYLIESSTDGVTYAEIATVPVGVTVYTDTGLTAATLYYYRVRAASASGYSDYSNVATATTFPGILDNFNRADEGPPPSASWVNVGFADGLEVISNQCGPDPGTSSGTATWNTIFGADQRVFATIPVMLNNWNVYLYARVPNSANSWTLASYSVQAEPGFVILHYWDGAAHLLGWAPIVWAAGNKVMLTCIGTTIKAYVDQGAGWVEKVSAVDSHWTGAGYIGVRVTEGWPVPGNRIDDFGG